MCLFFCFAIHNPIFSIDLLCFVDLGKNDHVNFSHFHIHQSAQCKANICSAEVLGCNWLVYVRLLLLPVLGTGFHTSADVKKSCLKCSRFVSFNFEIMWTANVKKKKWVYLCDSLSKFLSLCFRNIEYFWFFCTDFLLLLSFTKI